MKTLHRSTLTLIILILALMLAVPALAQDSQPVTAKPSVLAFDLEDLFVLGVSLVGLLTTVYLWARNRGSGTSLDTSITLRLEAMQQNRDAMDRMERMYQQSELGRKQVIDLFGQFFTFIAPYTTIKADDRAAALIRDIQKPGVPAIDATDPQSSAAAAKALADALTSAPIARDASAG